MACSRYGLLTKPSLLDFLQEKLITIVPFATALIAIFRYSDHILWPLLYIGIIIFHMTHIVIKRCPHCAYYKTETRGITCLWLRWVPKIREIQSSPVPGYFRIYTPIAIFTITFFPVYWLASQWELLLIYALSWGVLALSLYTAGCARCIDFSCKFNAVPQEARYEYLSSENKYPNSTN